MTPDRWTIEREYTHGDMRVTVRVQGPNANDACLLAAELDLPLKQAMRGSEPIKPEPSFDDMLHECSRQVWAKYAEAVDRHILGMTDERDDDCA